MFCNECPRNYSKINLKSELCRILPRKIKSNMPSHSLNLYRTIYTAKLSLVTRRELCLLYRLSWLRSYSPVLFLCSCKRSLRSTSIGSRDLVAFPHCQHRPILVSLGIQIPIIQYFPRLRWKLKKHTGRPKPPCLKITSSTFLLQ